MQVGTTKDQGLYNKLSAAVHSVALAAGTLTHNITKFHLLKIQFNPSYAELNPIRHLLALVGATIFSTLAG